MKNVRYFSVLNLLALLAHICFSYGTQLKLFNSSDVGEVSARYESLFTPAGFTFSIWGLIYLALLIFCIYHIVAAYRSDLSHTANRDTLKISGSFIANNLAAAAWLVAWTREMIGLSVVLIFFQLLCLIIIHTRLGIHNPARGTASTLFTQIPLSIYLGWISIASIANVSAFLASIPWSGAGISYITWTVIMIVVAVLLTSIMVLARKNVAYGLVVIWALYGIIIKRQSVDAARYDHIIQAAWIGMAVVALLCIVRFSMNLRIHTHRHAAFPLSPHSLK